MPGLPALQTRPDMEVAVMSAQEKLSLWLEKLDLAERLAKLMAKTDQAEFWRSRIYTLRMELRSMGVSP